MSDAESFSTARRAAREEGLLLGGSSGTAWRPALRYAAKVHGEQTDRRALPGHRPQLSHARCMTTGWMAENGFVEQPVGHVTVGDVLAALDREGKLICLEADETPGTRGGPVRHRVTFPKPRWSRAAR